MEVQQVHFIELRAAGQSYNKISEQLNVSKPTLIKWSKEYRNEIENAKALEIETIREEYFLNRQHRTRVLGSHLNRITEELLKRDLEEVPTWRLFEIERKLTTELKKDPSDIEFCETIRKDGAESIAKLILKTDRWTG
jgi:transposase